MSYCVNVKTLSKNTTLSTNQHGELEYTMQQSTSTSQSQPRQQQDKLGLNLRTLNSEQGCQ